MFLPPACSRAGPADAGACPHITGPQLTPNGWLSMRRGCGVLTDRTDSSGGHTHATRHACAWSDLSGAQGTCLLGGPANEVPVAERHRRKMLCPKAAAPWHRSTLPPAVSRVRVTCPAPTRNRTGGGAGGPDGPARPGAVPSPTPEGTTELSRRGAEPQGRRPVGVTPPTHAAWVNHSSGIA